MRRQNLIGYKGASSMEEEWKILVKEVYLESQNDPNVDAESLNRLRTEFEQLEENQVSQLNLYFCCLGSKLLFFLVAPWGKR